MSDIHLTDEQIADAETCKGKACIDCRLCSPKTGYLAGTISFLARAAREAREEARRLRDALNVIRREIMPTQYSTMVPHEDEARNVRTLMCIDSIARAALASAEGGADD